MVGKKGVSWRRDTELVTMQGEELRSLTGGQICPAEESQPRP